MSADWARTSIRACLASDFTGEWGVNPLANSNALVLRSTNLDDDGHVDLAGGAPRSISRAKIAQKWLRTGDVLLEASGGGPGKPVGRVALFSDDGRGPYLCSNFFRALRPAADVVPEFLASRLLHFYRQPSIWVYQQQTTGIINLKHLEYLKQEFELPPVLEQRRIAAILDTLDETIRRTEEVIAKLKQMKQGLLHDLLTRGVDENGELRPSSIEAPHLYKESPLGQIPSKWEVGALGGFLSKTEYGISEALADAGAIPVLRMMNFADGEAVLTDLKFSNSPLALATVLLPGDVLFNRTNSIDHVGRTGIWRGQIQTASFASYLVRLVPSPGCLTSEFLNRWLNWNLTQVRIRRWATPGVHQVNINPTNLRRTLLALPTAVEEQDRVSQVLASGDGNLNAVKVELAKLRTLKLGLMEDLLTGRIRVPNPSDGELA